MLVAILFAAFGFVFFDRLALNYLSPFFKDELGINNTMLGLLGGIPALTWALSGLFIGALSDKLDRRKPLLVIMVLAFSCFSALSGLVGGIASLLLVRAVMGVAEGGVLPISQTLVLYSSSEKRRGLNMGLVQGSSAGLLGGVVGSGPRHTRRNLRSSTGSNAPSSVRMPTPTTIPRRPPKPASTIRNPDWRSTRSRSPIGPKASLVRT